MAKADKLKDKIQQEITELTASINEIIETFRQMRNPLLETRSKVPLTTVQLDKITEQTEAATNRMLDTIETITGREEQVIRELEQLKAWARQTERSIPEMTVDGIIENVRANLDDAYRIMDVLQFQDITSQQMHHAAAMLEEIENKLQSMLAMFGASEEEVVEILSRGKKARVFDPHASLFETKNRQADVDSMFKDSPQK